ncbi:unnamed protein product [Vicia faba]|uniref:Uncharacterized protein n=1 Tax=Vicia faba TaxID=3906 RepID=A0AAV1AJ08_VICFA|nr:unnamed protein product [Vicia faba]
MAFTVKSSESALTAEREKGSTIDYHNRDKGENNKDSLKVGDGISSQLQLKSLSQTFDKHVVLRRIKKRKSYNKAKSAFESLLGILKTEANAAQEQKLLQHDDTFSSP